MTDSTMTATPLVERLLKISNDEYLALGDGNCHAIDQAAAMLKAAVDALDLARNRLRAAAINEAPIGGGLYYEYSRWADEADNTLATLKQPGGR